MYGVQRQFFGVEEGGGRRQHPIGTWRRRLWGEGGGQAWASLLPPCSLLHCTAAVSAGMAPLTICSLIANIRVHFLRHWTGTERWRAVLWAFLSLSPPLPFSLYVYSLWLWCRDTQTRTHTHKLDRQPLSHSANLYYLAVSSCPSISEHTQMQPRSRRTRILGAFYEIYPVITRFHTDSLFLNDALMFSPHQLKPPTADRIMKYKIWNEMNETVSFHNEFLYDV